MTLGACILLFNLSALSQNRLILDHVTNTKDYTTIDLVHMDPQLSTFAYLVTLANMDEQLINARAHTLFVPTNKAFENMSVKNYVKLMDPNNREQLTQFIQYYFLPQKVKKEDFKDGEIIKIGFDEGFAVSVDRSTGDMVNIGGANIIKADIQGSNGILDIIDAIFQPSENNLMD